MLVLCLQFLGNRSDTTWFQQIICQAVFVPCHIDHHDILSSVDFLGTPVSPLIVLET